MILAIVFTLISLLFSVWGVMIFLLGLSSFFMLPLISKASRFKVFSRFFLRLATFPLKRSAFVISESNEAYFKQLNLDLGMLSTTLGGDEKMIEDPAQRMHHWLGMRFGLVDEEHGVVFAPQDAANGMRKRDYDDNDEGEYLATEDEWDSYGVAKWKPLVFVHSVKHELVDLNAVQELFDGGERSEFAKRVEELYKHSQDPFGGSPSIGKFLYPILGFVIPFFGIWVMVSQVGGPSSTVSYNSFLGLLLLGVPGVNAETVKDRLSGVDWRGVGAMLLLVGTPLLLEALLWVFLGPVLAISITVIYLLGMILMPILTLSGKASSAIGGGLSKLYFRLGFLGYRRPVFEWTPAKYRLREYDELETADQTGVTWYEAFGSLIGFTYDSDPSSFGAEYLTQQELEDQQPVRDGGKALETNLPTKYVRSEQIKRDNYGAFLPKRVRDSKLYIHTGIAMDKFKNTADGTKSLRKLLEAKDEHGGGDDGVDNDTVLKLTVVTTIFGALSGIAIFLLPAFL